MKKPLQAVISDFIKEVKKPLEAVTDKKYEK